MSERRKPYPFDQIEPKWQAHLGRAPGFPRAESRRAGFRSGEAEILRARHVPLPERRGAARRPSGRLHRHRHRRALQAHARLQRAAPDGLGRVRSARRAIRDQDRPASGDHHPRERREVQDAAEADRFFLRLGARGQHDRSAATIKWTQWIFLQIYNSWFNPETNKAEPISTYRGDDPDSVRLAYVAEVPVNWCPELGTVLANEEVIDGKSEVGGFPVVRRPMRQWMLRITAYAERLIDELDGLDWPEGIKLLQRNWIGRSEGAEIDFDDRRRSRRRARTIRVFTTRPDTLYGATYMVLAPEHPLVDRIDDRGAAAGGRRVSRAATARRATSSAPNWRRKKPASSPALTRSIRSTTNASRSGSPTMCCWATAPARSWPCRRTTSATWSSRGSSICRFVEVVQAAGRRRRRADWLHRRRHRDQFAADRRTADARKRRRESSHWLERTGLGKRDDQLQTARLAILPPALLGRAVPDRLARRQTSKRLPESELPLVPPPLDDFKPTGTGEPPLAKAKDWIRYSETARRARRTRCRNGRARAGITCASAIRRTTSASSAKKRSATGWAATQAWRRRSLRRRHRARGAASALRAVLAQGALRSRPCLERPSRSSGW